ncbi:hypothetical protein [Mesoterricola sediminis]|uniref:Uncharacterized protein n=1 Tax=Mesoterricola sediminis TaxID=2927980 RepID=A0AA48GY97_9BACT|nr:hypothetical protein [Mesoterricola sediminis]BDU76247.1 hypothetical protein METESE_12050 [Mesoterricola sediminis]
MSTRKTGFLRRVWCPADFEAAMVRDIFSATRDQLIRLVLLQKAVLIAEEDRVSKSISQTGGTPLERTACLHMSRAIEASPQHIRERSVVNG